MNVPYKIGDRCCPSS